MNLHKEQEKVQKAMNSTLSGLQEEDWLNNEWIPMVTNDASEPEWFRGV